MLRHLTSLLQRRDTNNARESAENNFYDLETKVIGSRKKNNNISKSLLSDNLQDKMRQGVTHKYSLVNGKSVCDCGSECCEEAEGAGEGKAGKEGDRWYARQSSVNPHEVCHISDSPFYVLTLCTKGKIQEFEKIITADPMKLSVVDRKGRGVLHHAAKGEKIPMMDFILGTGADINTVDHDGNTALHVAVECNKKESLTYLLTHDADSSALNHRHMAPIHLAVELDKPECLEVLLSFDSVDKDQGGENGSTALHIAAWMDKPNCAQILLESGARMCKPCDIGLYPLHIAAQNSSSATLEILLEHAEKRGCSTRKYLLEKVNQEKNTPLHAAVAGGNVKIVEMCLAAGAGIDVQQENGNTPVHLAAAQGALDMIRLMFDMQPDKKITCLTVVDQMGLTVLHKAAMMDRTETVQYLIELNCDIDARANDGQTPLLLAAAKRAWGSVGALLNSGANIEVVDPDGRNILHLIIFGGGRPLQLKDTLNTPTDINKVIMKLLNEQDTYGCTPLHYASKKGFLASIDQLLSLGASPNTKNNKKQSALHFAAKHGRYNTCLRLISSEAGASILNEADGTGQTALHAAAEGGHARVIQLLLQSGAGAFKDLNGNTPLHLAAIGGYTQSITALLNVHPQLLDSVNKNLDTSLHVAAVSGHDNVVTLLLNMGAKILLNKDRLHVLDISIKYGKKDVCIAVISHDRWNEAMAMKSTLYGCPMVGMIKYMPEVCLMILDRCRTTSGCDPKAKDFHYIYDFRYMQCDHDYVRRQRKQGKKGVLPMFALNVMVQFNRIECLSHPVCTAFLSMKWCAYGLWFHLLNLFIYIAFLLCLTVFVSTYDFSIHSPTSTTAPPSLLNQSNTSSFLDSITDNLVADGAEGRRYIKVKLSVSQMILAIAINAFSFLNMLKELIQMKQQRWAYLGEPVNLLEWILYLMSAGFSGPLIMGRSNETQWQFGAVALFLAWFNLLLFLQRFGVFGIYVVMFLEILKTLIQVITVFSVLVVAFGFAFYILLNTGGAPSFSSPELSIVSTSVMMLGNIDYLDVWIHPYAEKGLPNSTLNFLFLLIFILLMPILLINLLIGLAVGDIEAVQKNARLKRIAMQVQLHTELEQKLPSRILKFVDKATVKVFPNRASNICQRKSQSKHDFKAYNNQQTVTNIRMKTAVRQRLRKIKNKLMRKNYHEPSSEAFLMSSDSGSDQQIFLYREMSKQKNRLKQISSEMTRHYDMLRLIVQKMEIHSEADDIDQDSYLTPIGKPNLQGEGPGIGWSSPALRQVMLKQALVLNKWRKSETD